MPPDNQRGPQKLLKRRVWVTALLLILSVNLAWLSFDKEETVAETEAEAIEVESIEVESIEASVVKGGSDNPTSNELIEPASTYQSYELDNATVHVVRVPTLTPISVVVAQDLMTVEEFAQQLIDAGEPPSAILNGGFFDPNNGKTTSHLTSAGEPAGDPADNEGLTGNPKMQPYLAQIFNRSEFRFYDCSLVNLPTTYAIVPHDAPVPAGCNLGEVLGAGPQLLPKDTSEAEAFTQYDNGELVRDAIGSVYPNARSAIGIHGDGAAMLFMVAQRPDAPGFTLTELSEFAASLGAVQLLNLDGGSSSGLYYDGELHLARLTRDGEVIERPVKSVIVVK